MGSWHGDGLWPSCQASARTSISSNVLQPVTCLGMAPPRTRHPPSPPHPSQVIPEQQGDNAFKLQVTVPPAAVQACFQKIVDDLAKDFGNRNGFRQKSVPLALLVQQVWGAGAGQHAAAAPGARRASGCAPRKGFRPQPANRLPACLPFLRCRWAARTTSRAPWWRRS